MITIKSNTTSSVGTTRVGVGNLWDATYTLPDGTETTGPTARLSSRDGVKERVGAGSVLELGGQRVKVVEVDLDAKVVRLQPLAE